MQVISVRNVHEALPEVLYNLKVAGVESDSRAGPVIMFPTPVTIMYRNPTERVIFWEKRDANPFFHFFESLWMLNGQNDVKFPAMFSGNIAQYSDNGRVFNAAYGHRWRSHFGCDQLRTITKSLREDRLSRRQYLSMWDARRDLGLDSKDLPCNVGATFQVTADGSLDMVVHNRSNDIIWGALGANAVHFSMLQEFVASSIGARVGRYWQVSSNMHAYKRTLEPIADLADMARDGFRQPLHSPYSFEVDSFPIMSTDETTWFQDLSVFMKDGPIIGFRDRFFRQVATPLWVAWRSLKDLPQPERYDRAMENLEQCRATDWRRACEEWVLRRAESWRSRDSGEKI